MSPPPATTFTLRPAILRDCDRLATVTQRAFSTDPLFAKMYPGSSQHPQDFQRALRERQRVRCLDPSNLVLAAVAPSGEIAGFGIWNRGGAVVNPDAGVLMSAELAMEMGVQRVRAWVWGANRAEDREVMKAVAETTMMDRDRLWGVDRPRWYLQLLAVDPKYQRQGVGKLIVRHGMMRAERESVGCYLEASKMGEGMYRSLGWAEAGESTGGLGVGVPTKVLVWESEEVKRKREVLAAWGK